MISSHIPEIILICFLAVLVGGPYVLYLRWYVPRRDRLALERARIRVERRRHDEAAGVPPSPSDYHYGLTIDSRGFIVTDLRDKTHETVATFWTDIRRATAFKRDMFTVDCICLQLDRADGTIVEINEDMAGWNRLVEALPKQLPGCKSYSEWYSSVAFPPFTANPTEIYMCATAQNADECAPPNSR